MKFLLQTIAIIIFCFVSQQFFPWWTMAIISFVMGYVSKNKSSVSFLSGFLGVGLLWFAMAFYSDYSTQSILSEKVNKLLQVNVFIPTVFIGGLVGGLASLSGSLLNKKRISKYY